MPRQFRWIVMIALIAVTACSSGSPTAPTVAVSPAAQLGAVYQAGDMTHSALGVYTVALDPDTLQATVALTAARRAQDNDDVYVLAIDNFLRPDSLRIRRITATEETLELTYSVTHPLPAPTDPAAPASASNRADLGITGFACFLADVDTAEGHTYFTDRVVNTELVTNADAYFAPAGLITYSGIANVFPYKLLVDELADSREGISNGGVVTGNYGGNGWTRTDLGPTFDGWTGYDFLAQGQTSLNTVSLNKAALAEAGFSFDVAIIAQYNDPRGGATAEEKRANRLPAYPADFTKFAYRMPHGALDVSRIEYLGESGGFLQNQESTSTLAFRVTDWDARATATSHPELADDPVLTNVTEGAAGIPSLALCIPGVLGDATVVDEWDTSTLTDDDTAYGGDPAADSGEAGDALLFTKAVVKVADPDQGSGSYTGLMRALDATIAEPQWIPLDESVPPQLLTAGQPAPMAYQAFTVELENRPPSGEWDLIPYSINDGGLTTVVVSNVVDPGASSFGIEVDWGDGNGFVLAASGLAPGEGPFVIEPSPVYTLADPQVSETRELAVRLVDESTMETDLATNIGNDTLFIHPAGESTGWVYMPGTLAPSDFDDARFITVDTVGNALVTGTSGGPADFGGGIRGEVGNGFSYLVKLDPRGNYLWDRVLSATPLSGGWWDSASFIGLDCDAASNIYCAGSWSGELTLGGEFIESNGDFDANFADLFVARYDPAGVLQWINHSSGDGSIEHLGTRCLDVNAAGESLFVMAVNRTQTWGPFSFSTTTGPDSLAADPSFVRMSPAGVIRDARLAGDAFPAEGNEYALGAAIDDDNNIYIGGTAQAGADFGGGPWPPSPDGSPLQAYIVKFRGDSGTNDWERRMGGTNGKSTYCFGLAVNASTVFATGECADGVDFGGGPRSSASVDPFVVAYTLDGSYVWDAVYRGPLDDDYGLGIAADAQSVWVSGFFYRSLDFGLEGGVLEDYGTATFVTRHNPANGTIERVLGWGTPSDVWPGGIAINSASDPYLAVNFSGIDIDWDPGTGITRRSAQPGFTAPLFFHWNADTNSF